MIIGIIPARGGSKGIPRKNLIPICGQPLLYWTIKSAIESELLNEFFVSTEDEEIADYARAQGARVIERPTKFATDDATTIELLQHHFQTDFGSSANICTLQPTSPIRAKNKIDNCVRVFLEKKPYILASGFDCKIEEFGSNNNVRRQDIPGYFYDDGNVYIHSEQALIDGVWSRKDALKIYSKESETYEIDTLLDSVLVDFLLSRLLD